MSEKLHTVILIDDDESMCQAMTRLLTASGYQVRCFFSAEAYLDDPSAGESDSLVVDVGLPGMSGIELVSLLRAQRSRIPPITFISAHDEPQIQREAEKAGCVAFLNKPFLAQTLMKALHPTLENSP